MKQERWHCNNCGAEFAEPLIEYTGDPWFGRTDRENYCPLCRDRDVVQMDDCPSCEGYKMPGDECCQKCKLRGVGELGRFARSLPVPILRYLDCVIEGTGLELFR